MRTILVAIGAHYVHINLAVYALKACCDGDVEVNCTFETLVRMVRNEVVGDVTKALFA